MNAEDVDKLEAGEKLDKLISENVMGIHWPHLFVDLSHPDASYFNRRYYSTDIAAAWLVVEKMHKLHLTTAFIGYFDAGTCWHWAALSTQALCLNICRAALKASIAQQPEGAGE